MSDPYRHWDGYRWLQWDGRAWVPLPPAPAPVPPPAATPWAGPPTPGPPSVAGYPSTAVQPPPQGYPAATAYGAAHHPGYAPGPAYYPAGPPAPRRGNGALIAVLAVAAVVLLLAGTVIAVALVAGSSGSQRVASPTVPGRPPAATGRPDSTGPDALADVGYDEGLDRALEWLDDYWSAAMRADFDRRWLPPAQLIPYSPSRESGPPCYGDAPGDDLIAYYCPRGERDFVAWDAEYMRSLHEQIGPMAPWVVMAHEFGHVAQAVLWAEFDRTFEKELQADCYAGAWAGWAAEQGLVGDAAADQAEEFYRSNGAIGRNTVADQLAAYNAGVAGGADRCATEYAPGFSR